MVHREKFIAVNAILKKEKNLNLISHLKKLEKEKQTKSKASRRQEIIEIRAKINDSGNKKDNREN